MNRPVSLSSLSPEIAQAVREADALHLHMIMAERILVGDFDCLPTVEHELYDISEWREAAEYLESSGDDADFANMLNRERVYQWWMDLSDAEQERWAGFGNYFDRMGPSILRRAA